MKRQGSLDFHRLKRRGCLKDWTVLIYMQADNDLSKYALWDIYEMERKVEGFDNKGTSSDKIDVLVQVDFFKNSGLRRYHVFQGNKPYHVKEEKESFFDEKSLDLIESPLVEVLKEEKEGVFQDQNKLFYDFLKWGFENYPSENYMIVIWGHGRGYIGQKKTGSSFQGGVGSDDSNLSYLDIPSLAEAIERINEEFLPKGDRVDILAMDACLMQTLEVNLEFSDKVKFFLASSQVQNYMGLPYRSLWDHLNLKDEVAPEDWARAIPSLYEKSLKKKRLYSSKLWAKSYSSFTYSTVFSDEMQVQRPEHFNFFRQWMKFSRRLREYFHKNSMQKLSLLLELERSPYFIGDYRDIGVFLSLVLKVLYQDDKTTKESVVLKEEIHKVQDHLGRTLYTYSYGSDFTEAKQNPYGKEYFLGAFKGLSVWVPSQKELFQSRWDVMKTSRLLSPLNPWSCFLFELFESEGELDGEQKNECLRL